MKLNEQQILHLAVQAKLCAHKHGYLFKKSGKKNTLPDHVGVRWQKRWCVVYYNMFFYFESHNTAKPQGVIFLEGAKSQMIKVADKELFCFTIGIPFDDQRQFLFGCESEQERSSWIEAASAMCGENLVCENNSMTTKLDELDVQIQEFKDDKEQLRQQVSDQWSQISRLKHELSTIRGSIESSRTASESGKTNTSSSSTLEVFEKEYTNTEISKLIKLQAKIRSWLACYRWNGFVKPYIKTFGVTRLQQRNVLLLQFVASEEDYVQQMSVLSSSFLAPMKIIAYSNHVFITKEEVKKIFCNSESILVLHQVFVKGLKARMKNWPAVHLDDLLFAVVTVIPIYVEYIKNMPTAFKTLGECKKRSEFVKQLKWFESKPACNGQTLEQFLHYPIRVVPNYIRHVHDILEVTPVDHVERESLETILEKLQEAQTYNHFLDEAENLRHTLEIERLIEGGCHLLLTENQKFVRHGVLKQLGVESRFASVKKEKIRHCFLFSHHLLIASRTVDGRLRLSKHCGCISLFATTLQEDVAISTFPEHMNARAFTLNVMPNNATSEPFSVTLMATKTAEKAVWTSDISQCIFNLALEEDDSSDDEENKSETFAKESRDVISTTIKEEGYTVLPLKEDNRLREDADDIKYGEELVGPYHLPQIMHGSVERLIERLSDPRLPGADFMETFLLTYRAFTSGKEVMAGLINAYWEVMGGRPSPNKADSLERTKTAVNRTSSSRNRVRSILSTSSFSSIEDLEASFNSSASPFSSTTVFNYNTLKEQLNSPTRRSAATSKWCEDSAAVTSETVDVAKQHPRRSISACNVSVEAHSMKLSRSQSVEVLVHPDKEVTSGDSAFTKCRSCDVLSGNYATKVGARKIPISQSSNPTEDQSNSRNDFPDALGVHGYTVESMVTAETDDSFNCDTSLLTGGVSMEVQAGDSFLKHNDSLFVENLTSQGALAELNEQGNIREEDAEKISIATKSESMSGISDELSRTNSNASCVESFNNGLNNSSILDSEDAFFDMDRTSTMGSANSVESTPNMSRDRRSPNVSGDRRSATVPHSNSDELLYKKRSTSELQLPSKSNSLDQKKVFSSPYFRRKKKEKKKEKSGKHRSASDPNNDSPVLLNIKDRRTGLTFNRSTSYYDTHREEPEGIEENGLNKKMLSSTSSLPVSVPDIQVKQPSPDVPKRKRSMFLGSFHSPFKKGGLKRASSEQVLTVAEQFKQGIRSHLSNSTISLEGRHERTPSNRSVTTVSESIGDSKDRDVDTMSIQSMPGDNLNVSIKGDRTFGKKKKLKTPMKHLSVFNTTKEVTRPARRKTSVFEQGRPPVDLKKSVSVNRGPLKIMSIFKHWLAKHPKDFIEDSEMIEELHQFFRDIKEDLRTLPVVKEIVASLEKSLIAHRKSMATVHPFDELLLQQHYIQQQNDVYHNPDMMEIKPLETYSYRAVAENMTLLEHYLYAKISFNFFLSEFVCCQWTKKDKETKAPGIMKFIKRFNQVTQIISYTVVHGESQHVRASMIEFWIRVAAHCRDLNNFNAIMEIISALNASPVHRLKKSWELVARTLREVFSDLENLVSADRSFKQLREAVHMCNPPCVPYLGSYLSDLLFVHEGGKTLNEDGLVNFAKMCRISRSVREVKCYQQLPYTLDVDREIAYALVNFDKAVDEDMLYEQSLLAEPRGS